MQDGPELESQKCPFMTVHAPPDPHVSISRTTWLSRLLHADDVTQGPFPGRCLWWLSYLALWQRHPSLHLTQTSSSRKESPGSHCNLAPQHRPQTTGDPGHHNSLPLAFWGRSRGHGMLQPRWRVHLHDAHPDSTPPEQNEMDKGNPNTSTEGYQTKHLYKVLLILKPTGSTSVKNVFKHYFHHSESSKERCHRLGTCCDSTQLWLLDRNSATTTCIAAGPAGPSKQEWAKFGHCRSRGNRDSTFGVHTE